MNGAAYSIFRFVKLVLTDSGLAAVKTDFVLRGEELHFLSPCSRCYLSELQSRLTKHATVYHAEHSLRFTSRYAKRPRQGKIFNDQRRCW